MSFPFKALTIDNLKIQIYNSPKEMGDAAYEHYREYVVDLLKKQQLVRAVFAAAHSQDDFLEALSADSTIDFSCVIGFHMDEYIGLGIQAPQNFGNFLRNAIFSRKPFHEIHYIQSDSTDIRAECKRYEDLLRKSPLDIVSMGVGENGHIAFNDPHEAKFNEKAWVRSTSLDDICRLQQVHDGEFKTLSDVPKIALTLTIPALMSCQKVVCIVPSSRKAQAVHDALYGPISEKCPASILRNHPDATMFLDREAAKLI